MSRTSSLGSWWSPGQPADGCLCLYSSVVLDNYMCCKFPPVLNPEWLTNWSNSDHYHLTSSNNNLQNIYEITSQSISTQTNLVLNFHFLRPCYRCSRFPLTFFLSDQPSVTIYKTTIWHINLGQLLIIGPAWAWPTEPAPPGLQNTPKFHVIRPTQPSTISRDI